MRLEPKEKIDNTFNLLPLIDVVFLLLVFFLASTTFSKEEVEMDLELPKATSGVAGGEDHLLVIAVARDGRFTVDGRLVTLEALRQKLAAAAVRNPEQEILIRGDWRVEFGQVAQAFDACLAASLSKVSIAADPVQTGETR